MLWKTVKFHFYKKLRHGEHQRCKELLTKMKMIFLVKRKYEKSPHKHTVKVYRILKILFILKTFDILKQQYYAGLLKDNKNTLNDCMGIWKCFGKL